MINLGGNLVQTVQSPIDSFFQFAQTPYFYQYHNIKRNSVVNLEHFKSGCIFLISGAIAGGGFSLDQYGDTLLFENLPLSVSGLSEENHVLVVGSTQIFSEQPGIRYFQFEKLKKVEKPWGNEIWITGEHPGYCLKKIFIKKGTKTSLQYHNFKRETNVLFDGKARLYFKSDFLLSNDAVAAEHIAFYEMAPISIIDIFPGTLHRLEAVSDITLYEVSTPQLDDVIRVADDSNRQNGRIPSEHKKNES